MHLTNRDNPVFSLKEMNNFCKKYNETYIEGTRFANTKRWLYRNLWYPVLRFISKRRLEKNVKFCWNNPIYFIDVITSFVASLIYHSQSNQETLNKTLDRVFSKDYSPLKIIFITDPTTNKLISYKVIVSNLSYFTNFNLGKMTRVILNVHINSGLCDLDIEYYTTPWYDDKTEQCKPKFTKYLKISSTSGIINPNYVFDINLERADIELYCNAISFIFTPIISLYLNITTVRFLPKKYLETLKMMSDVKREE